MTKSITVYVPEERFFEAKARDARRFGESLAIIDASDLSLVAGRGSLFRDPEASHFLPEAAGIRREDLHAFLADPAEPFSVLAVSGGVAILFPQLLDATGLLPLLWFRATPGSVRKVREFAIRDAKSHDFDEKSLAFGAETSTGNDGVEHICAACTEAQKLFSGSGQKEFRLLLHFAANCAGCRLDHILLPPVYPDLTEKSRKTLIAFLLCAFLSARERDGEVTIAARTSRERFSLAVEQMPLGVGSSFGLRSASPEKNSRADFSATEPFSAPHFGARFEPLAIFPETRGGQSSVPESFPVFASDPVRQQDDCLWNLFPFTSAACFRDCVEMDPNGNLLFHAKLRRFGADELHSGIADGNETTLAIRLIAV